MPDVEPPSASPRQRLSLLDSTCIIVGIVIGATIYESVPLIARSAGGPISLMTVWLAGGALSLIGALCYAELATAYPREGGDYVYLTKAMGRRIGFLFAWAWFWVVRPGSVGAMAFIFAHYAEQILPVDLGREGIWIYAAGSIVVLTLVNVLNVRGGAWTQNALTLGKVAGLIIIFFVGLLFPAPRVDSPPAAAESNWPLAMIFVLFAYGGWSDMSYVAAEVRNPRHNILRALLLGTAAVTLIYLLLNVAFVRSMGFEGIVRSEALAAEVLEPGLGRAGAVFISLLICVSSLSAINGMILTGSRIYYAMGTDHRVYRWLGRWNERFGTPARSLIVQAAATVSLIVGFGMYEDGFERMALFTSPVFWLFLTLVGVSLMVLRFREPAVERPFRVPGYPVTPLVFCASSLFMLYASVTHAWEHKQPEALWTLIALAAGLVMCLFVDRRPHPQR